MSKNQAPPDPRDAPAYPLAEAARYIRVAPATLRTWVSGRSYKTNAGDREWRPLIKIADAKHGLLSFSNIVEAHVLRSLRSDHVVPIPAVRKALAYAAHELGIERLLLSRELQTSAGDIFLERYGKLITLSKSGQLAMKAIFEQHLRRVEWEDSPLPRRLYPFVTGELESGRKTIAIDPSLSFGRPIVLSHGISTRIIADRIDAGEGVEELATDYGMAIDDVKEAVLYEHAA